MQTVNFMAQTFTDGASNIYNNVSDAGKKAARTINEAANTEEIKADAKEIATVAQIGYGFAVSFTVFFVAGAFFALLHSAPISFLLCSITLLITLDVFFASQKVIEFARKVYESPLIFAMLTSREARFQMFRDVAIENTLFLKNFIPINYRTSAIGS